MSVTEDTDISGASRGVWLVKVPKYMDSEWKKAEPGAGLGKLITRQYASGKIEIQFDSIDPASIKPKAKNGSNSKSVSLAANNSDPKIPKSHEFKVIHGHKNISVFSHNKATGKTMVEGHVQQEGRFQPKLDKAYMSLSSERFRKANVMEREVKILDKVATGPKPVSMHKEDLLFEKKKKEAGKRARDDKDKVISMLMTAFEKHQYYAMRDLEKLTNQPVPYLKEILKEIGIYNNKNKHKNLWELKPEYRHYDSKDEPMDQ